MKMHQLLPASAMTALLLLVATLPLRAAERSDLCGVQPVNGECKARFERYYFDQEKERCTAYIYDGCGPVVPFETLEACRSLCEPPRGVVAPGASLAHDPVEDDPRYAAIFKGIDAEVAALLADHPQRGSMGFVNIVWETKQRLLKSKYGIDWHTPAELNPQVIFD
jgi:hypothetical protein